MEFNYAVSLYLEISFSMKKYYITTSIDYVNAKPHIGHVLEKVQADAAARYHRLQGKDTFFLVGTDEHGAKIARAAEAKKKKVENMVDENAQAFKKLWDNLNISNNYFIRTTNQKKHWPAVREVWRTLNKNGDIYKKEYEGLYCYGHEAFVTKKDLTEDGECEIHGEKAKPVKEENYFFKLSKYTDRIKKAIQDGKLEIVPKERENEVLKFLDKGLEDVSFSRPRKDLKWGVPVPNDKSQTVYVWADALTNYISALGWPKNKEKFNKYWPADVHVIGKDILRFHAAIWPAMLLSMKLPLPKKIFVHGFVNVEGQKMSKSLGNIIDPVDIIKNYGRDALRYYMLAEVPAYKDGDYSQEKFESLYNGDLALGLGNFLSRVVSLGSKYLDTPLESKLVGPSKRELDKRWESYQKHMENFRFDEAIKQAQKLIAHGDERINQVKLWELAKNNEAKFKEEISSLATVLAYAAWMLYPVIPDSAEEIFSQLGIKPEQKQKWKFEMKKGKHLFQRL